VLARVVVEQRRAAAAADLSALTGATAVQQGRRPCAAAASSAAVNGAELTGCTQQGEEVAVVVTMPFSVVGRAVRVTARAEAGPVTGAEP
jgi:secretion/DNA translocation related TadE-like protein